MEIRDTINKCVALEQAIASIYSTFMKKFPEDRDFWEDLCSDEMKHASLLNDADTSGSLSGYPVKSMISSIPFVEKTIEFAKGIKKQITSGAVTPEYAFETALRLENTVVEIFTNRIITDLKTDNNEALSVHFRKMLTAEKDHVDKIRDMMKRKGYDK
jgi:hypothetical protein